MIIIQNKYEIGQEVWTPAGRGTITCILIGFGNSIEYTVKIWDEESKHINFLDCLESELND
jgi:hypothetical protein